MLSFALLAGISSLSLTSTFIRSCIFCSQSNYVLGSTNQVYQTLRSRKLNSSGNDVNKTNTERCPLIAIKK